MTYTLVMRCEGGAEERIDIETCDRKEAAKQTRDWIRDGDWGENVALVDGRWQIEDENGDLIDEGCVSVEIEPNHSTLIRRACGSRYDAAYERCCGENPDDHDWTSEGEGGCDENPGVWSHGGTKMSFADHCRKCGLHRLTVSYGSQRNPGQNDSVEYDMPESWCDECECEECNCDNK